MGIDYSAVSGFGFVLSHEEDDLEQIAKNVGFVSKYDDQDYLDEYELAEWIASKYGLDYVMAGDAMSGDTCILIGETQSTDIYGLAETPMPKKFDQSAELLTNLKNAIRDMGVPKVIAFYAGMYIS